MSFLDQEPIPCVINGKAVQTKKCFTSLCSRRRAEQKSRTFDLIDPHDASAEPKVIYKVAGAGMEDVDAAVDAAWAAFPAWSATDYAQRRAILLKAAQLVRDRVNDLIAIETRETTSAETWAGFTIGKLSPESIEETACCLTSLRGEIVPSPAGQTTYIERKPYGVVVGIAPW